MQRPTLLPTSAAGERFAGITYHLDGELVPALTVELDADASIFFEHHTLLWKNTGVNIGMKAMRGAFKRMMAGMQVFMTEASGTGQIAFSRDGAGHIFPLHLTHGQEVHVREHQFLAATSNIDYTFEMVKSISSLLYGNVGFFIDKFHASAGDGVLWLHGYGNVFEITLGAGEQIDVEPGAWLYKDPAVSMSTTVTRLSTGLLAGSSFTLNRLTGPGKVGLQSMSLNALPAETGKSGQASGLTAATFGLAALITGLFSSRN